MSDRELPDKPRDLSRLALSLATLSLAGFSSVLCAQTLSLAASSRLDFASGNVLGVHPRQTLLFSIAAGIATPIFAALAALSLQLTRGRMLGALHGLGTLCAPLIVAFVVPGLFLDQVAESKPLFYLTVLLAFGFALHELLTQALTVAPAWRIARWYDRLSTIAALRAVPAIALTVCTFGYAIVLGRCAVSHHRLIQDVARDLGVADNVMSNLMHGHFFRAPAQFGTAPGSWLSLHAEYGALLFLPIYLVRPGAETLLWLQVALAALAVVPLYLLVAGRLGRGMALWFGVGYLLWAPLHGALLVGFSWQPAVTLSLFTLYYALDADRRFLGWVAALALLALSEVGALYAFAFGLYCMFSGKRPRAGLALTLIAVAVLVLDPAYFVLDLARAVKLTSVMHALAPLCFLPLFELAIWPLFLPALLLTSIGGTFWPSDVGAYPSSLVWLPACFLGLFCGLQQQRDERPNRARYWAWVVTLSLTQLSHSFDFGALLRADGFGGQSVADNFRMSPWGQKRYDQLMSLVRLIPASASVATTDFLLSHVSNRPDAYVLTRPYGTPEYVLLSSREVNASRAALTATFASHRYRLVGTGFDEFFLFSRGSETPDTRRSLARLGLGPQ
jgi:hypothetical protein